MVKAAAILYASTQPAAAAMLIHVAGFAQVLESSCLRAACQEGGKAARLGRTGPPLKGPQSDVSLMYHLLFAACLQYRRVQQQYVEACERYDREAQEVEELLARRDQAYLELYGISSLPTEAAESPGGPISRANSGAQQQQQQGEAAAVANGDAGAGASAADATRRLLGLGRLFSRKG
jgi:hypothetical protein